MVDLEDVVDAIVDIEDIVEEIADPEELLEDFLETPLLIAVALGAAVAAVLTVLLVLATVVVLVLAGPVVVLASLAFLGFLLTTSAVVGFVYLRTDVPAEGQRMIDAARERSDGTPHEGASMSERDAIDELKTQYAAGELTELELERALEDVLTSEDPGRVVERR